MGDVAEHKTYFRFAILSFSGVPGSTLGMLLNKPKLRDLVFRTTQILVHSCCFSHRSVEVDANGAVDFCLHRHLESRAEALGLGASCGLRGRTQPHSKDITSWPGETPAGWSMFFYPASFQRSRGL